MRVCGCVLELTNHLKKRMFSSIWPNKSPTNDEKKSPQQPSVREAKAKDQQSLEDTLPVPLVALIFFGLGFACSTGGALLYARYGRRIKTTDWIVPAYFEERRWIRGVVTRYGGLIVHDLMILLAWMRSL